MSEEFCLSNKFIEHGALIEMEVYPTKKFVSEEQVKEFIRILKENLGNDCTDCNNWNINFIDKLAGPKLT